MNDDQDHFNVLRKINSKPKSTQRELAEELGFSLGKLNYCLKALKTKGLIKMKNFEKNPNKINYIYVLHIFRRQAKKSPQRAEPPFPVRSHTRRIQSFVSYQR